VPHQIEVRKSGLLSSSSTITPRPGLEQAVEVTLLTEAQQKAARTPPFEIVSRQTPRLSVSEFHLYPIATGAKALNLIVQSFLFNPARCASGGVHRSVERCIRYHCGQQARPTRIARRSHLLQRFNRGPRWHHASLEAIGRRKQGSPGKGIRRLNGSKIGGNSTSRGRLRLKHRYGRGRGQLLAQGDALG